jgi:hypothetical protein
MALLRELRWRIKITPLTNSNGETHRVLPKHMTRVIIFKIVKQLIGDGLRSCRRSVVRCHTQHYWCWGGAVSGDSPGQSKIISSHTLYLRSINLPSRHARGRPYFVHAGHGRVKLWQCSTAKLPLQHAYDVVTSLWQPTFSCKAMN